MPRRDFLPGVAAAPVLLGRAQAPTMGAPPASAVLAVVDLVVLPNR
jgi:hypothetical protein